MLFSYPCISDLINHMCELMGISESTTVYAACVDLKLQLPNQNSFEDIAIVGMSCRLLLFTVTVRLT